MAGFGMGLAAVRRYIIINFSIIFPKTNHKNVCVFQFNSVQYMAATSHYNCFDSPIPNSIGKHNFSYLK